MLFFPTKIPGMIKVSYDEPSSTLFIWYSNKNDKDAYKIDRNYYQNQVFPMLNRDRDFRPLLIWGERNNFVEKIINAYYTPSLDKYEK